MNDTQPPVRRQGVGLCLSGGGYRAMLFHTGALVRLNELGWLPRINRVSSVSAGSIAAGTLACAWSRLRFTDGVAENLTDEFVEPIRRLAGRTLDVSAVILGVLLPWTTAGTRIAAAFAEHLFGDTKLADLDAHGPEFVFNATNLQDGNLWWFFRQPGPAGDIRLATAVAASAAFPPFLAPVVLPNPLRPGSRISLGDAGIFDNLGLDSVEGRSDTVLVSDAGGRMTPSPKVHRDWLTLLIRTLDIGDAQVRSLRAGSLLRSYEQRDFAGTYWGSYSDISNFDLPDALPAPVAATTKLADTKTRMAKLPSTLQEQLINWGYAVCDAGMRKYVDTTTTVPAAFPYQNAGVGP